jgi:hypothetical protein
VEVHRLDLDDLRHRWSVMVVSEHWWDEGRKPLRTHIWATHLSGSKQRIVDWFENQARLIEKGQATTD